MKHYQSISINEFSLIFKPKLEEAIENKKKEYKIKLAPKYMIIEATKVLNPLFNKWEKEFFNKYHVIILFL